MTSINSDSSRFLKSIADVDASKQKGDLHLKKIEDGKVVSKKGWQFIKAAFGHFFYKIIGKAKQKLEERFSSMLNRISQSYSVSKNSNHSIQLNKNLGSIKSALDILKRGNLQNQDLEHALNESYIKGKTDFLFNAPKNIKSLYREVEKFSLQADKIKDVSDKIHKNKLLTLKETLLMSQCLQLGARIENLTKHKKYINFFSQDQIKALKESLKMSRKILKNSEKLNSDFKKQFGKVEGKLPTKNQLVGAYNLLKNKMKGLYNAKDLINNDKTKELGVKVRKNISRALQLIMYGKNKIKEIPFPKSLECFTCKELENVKIETNLETEQNNLLSYLAPKIEDENKLTEVFYADISRKLDFGIDGDKNSIESNEDIFEKQSSNFIQVVKNNFNKILNSKGIENIKALNILNHDDAQIDIILKGDVRGNKRQYGIKFLELIDKNTSGMKPSAKLQFKNLLLQIMIVFNQSSVADPIFKISQAFIQKGVFTVPESLSNTLKYRLGKNMNHLDLSLKFIMRNQENINVTNFSGDLSVTSDSVFKPGSKMQVGIVKVQNFKSTLDGIEALDEFIHKMSNDS